MAKRGRPIKNGCDYYPHLTTMRNHKKVKALRNKFGSVLGYAFWAMILEYLTEADRNEIEYSDMEMEMFAAELGIPVEQLKEMIEYCFKIELLFLRSGFVVSESLNEWLSPLYEKREKAREISATRQRRNDGSFDNNTESSGIVATENTEQQVIVKETIPQSKRKEKKRKEIKKEMIVFDAFRKKYFGKKRGNATEFENFVKKHKDWELVLPTLESIIEKQKIDRDKEFKIKKWIPLPKDLKTWINGRHWEDEIPESKQINGAEKKEVGREQFYPTN